MMPCQGCTCAALLHTTMAVYCTLTDTCASPLPLAMCWQVWLSVLNSSVYESRLEEWQGGELFAPDLIGCGDGDRWEPEKRGLFLPLDWARGCEAPLHGRKYGAVAPPLAGQRRRRSQRRRRKRAAATREATRPLRRPPPRTRRRRRPTRT